MPISHVHANVNKKMLQYTEILSYYKCVHMMSPATPVFCIIIKIRSKMSYVHVVKLICATILNAKLESDKFKSIKQGGEVKTMAHLSQLTPITTKWHPPPNVLSLHECFGPCIIKMQHLIL